MNLVLVKHIGQMRAFAADIGNGCDGVKRKFSLHVKSPLWHIRPKFLPLDRCGWEVVHHRRRKRSTAADACVSRGCRATADSWGNIRLTRSKDSWRSTFERFCIGFVSVGIFLKNSISGANGHFPIAPRIEGEANPRAPINVVPFLESRQRLPSARRRRE